MNATETKVQFTFTSSINLTGATCTMTQVDPNGLRITGSLPMTVGTVTYTDPVTGLVTQPYFWAYRSTLATDFTLAGKYLVQLIATFADGTVRICNNANVIIGKTL